MQGWRLRRCFERFPGTRSSLDRILDECLWANPPFDRAKGVLRDVASTEPIRPPMDCNDDVGLP